MKSQEKWKILLLIDTIIHIASPNQSQSMQSKVLVGIDYKSSIYHLQVAQNYENNNPVNRIRKSQKLPNHMHKVSNVWSGNGYRKNKDYIFPKDSKIISFGIAKGSLYDYDNGTYNRKSNHTIFLS